MFSSRWRKGRKEEGGRDEGTVFFVGRRRSQEVTRPAPKEKRTDGFGVRLREIPLPVPPRVRRPLPSDARDNYLLSGCGSSIGRRRRRCPEARGFPYGAGEANAGVREGMEKRTNRTCPET